MRTTREELDALAAIVDGALGGDYRIGWAHGRPRLERAGGSVGVSPRLSANELAVWIRAYLAGIDAVRTSTEPRPIMVRRATDRPIHRRIAVAATRQVGGRPARPRGAEA